MSAVHIAQGAHDGSLSTRATVRAFLNIKYEAHAREGRAWPAEFEIVDGYPLWAEIYYSIRSGDYEEAARIATGAQQITAQFSMWLRDFVQSGGRIPQHQRSISREYHNMDHTRPDPYKQLLYVLRAGILILFVSIFIFPVL